MLDKRKSEGGAAAHGGQVQSVTRALAILNAIAKSDGGLTLSGVAQAVNLAPSTAHRLLTTLQVERFVRYDREPGVWRIGLQAFEVGNGFLASRDLASVARQRLEALVEIAGETAHLAVADRGEIIYLAQVECHEMVRAQTKLGLRLPMYCTAVGKALLAEYVPAEVNRILWMGLSKVTDRTITDPDVLKLELAKARRDRYAIDDEEHAAGLRCVAAAIFDEHAKPLGAVSISGPKIRMTDDRLAVLGGHVAQTARDITDALGGRYRS